VVGLISSRRWRTDGGPTGRPTPAPRDPPIARCATQCGVAAASSGCNVLAKWRLFHFTAIVDALAAGIVRDARRSILPAGHTGGGGRRRKEMGYGESGIASRHSSPARILQDLRIGRESAPRVASQDQERERKRENRYIARAYIDCCTRSSGESPRART